MLKSIYTVFLSAFKFIFIFYLKRYTLDTLRNSMYRVSDTFVRGDKMVLLLTIDIGALLRV